MIFYIFLGVIAGTITGLIPGLHSNNIVYFFTSISFFEKNFSYFVISMVITQSFVDFIPSVFFGAPDTDTFEGVLPGHKLFLEGNGFEAIILTIFGGICAIIFSILLIPIFQQFLIINNEKIIFLIPPVLIISSLILVLSEKNNKLRKIAIFVFIISASQGILFKDQLFPLISGYFGISTIIFANKKNNLIKQKNTATIKTEHVFDGVIGLIGGAIVSIFPGIGNNLAAAIIKLFRQNMKTKKYLVVLGSINTSNFLFSIPVLFVLNRARNGAAIYLKENFIFTEQTYILSIITIIISAGAGAIITIGISKLLCNKIQKIDFTILNYGLILILISLVIIFNGPIGFIALMFSTALGTFTISKKVKRSNCLGALIVPALFFYLFVLI
jgi:putative membrane protein